MIKKLAKMNLWDYSGQRINGAGPFDRKWYFSKCPEKSPWYNSEYNGEYLPWADGGCGYILSRKAMNIIVNKKKSNLEICENDIYEDLMIGKLLNKNNIFPEKIEIIIECDKRSD